MKLQIKNIYKYLFFIGLFFLPFTSVSILPIGEFEREACFYVFLIGLGFLILTKKVKIPKYRIAIYVYIFVFSAFILSLLNINCIKENYFKHTSGIIRFIKQYLVLTMMGLGMFIYFYNIVLNYPFSSLLVKLRKTLTYALYLCSLIGFFEVLGIVYKIEFFKTIFELFNYLPLVKVTSGNFDRIRTLAYEPPFLAIFLISIFGFMLSYILTEKKWHKYIPVVLVLTLTYFSGSRTALIVISFQLFIFIVLNLKERKKEILQLLLSVFVLFSVLNIISRIPTIIPSVPNNKISSRIESLDFKKNADNVSNKSRFGIQYASLKVFLDHPIIGVGLGQQAYYNRKYYPEWATKNNYEFSLWYNNEDVKSFPPGYNLYVRLLAELGIIGLLLFAVIILTVIYESFLLLRDPSTNIWGNILLISFIGLSINWLQIDSFRIFSYWIYVAILVYIVTKKKVVNE